MRTRVIAVAAAAATALSGCSMLSTDGDDSGSSSSDESSVVEGGEESAKTALAAGVDPEDPPEPVATGTFSPSSDDVDTTTIELVKLQPKDNVMLATFRLTGEGRGNASTSVYDLLGGQRFSPVFVDLDNLEKYKNIEDLSTDNFSTKAPLGEPVYVFTAFPLPRSGVEQMDLQLTQQSGSIEGIPMPKSS